jgi:hypothetical protein
MVDDSFIYFLRQNIYIMKNHGSRKPVDSTDEYEPLNIN